MFNEIFIKKTKTFLRTKEKELPAFKYQVLKKCHITPYLKFIGIFTQQNVFLQ